MTPKQKKILKLAVVPVFYLCSLVLFVRVTFPYETLKSRILAEYNASQTDKRLEIDDLSGNGLFGVEAEGLRLTEIVQLDADGKASRPQSLAVDEANVGISGLSYLFGSLVVDFDAKVGGGELFGDFEQNEEEARLTIEGEAIDISGLTLLSAGIGLPLGGELNGRVELFLPGGLMKKADGKFDLTVNSFTAGDGKAKVRDTIALPKISCGNLVLKAEAAEGRLELEEFSADGKDFELAAEGRLRLREPFDKSSVSIGASFKFKEAYTGKNDLTKSLFGSPGSKVPGLFDMDPTVRKAKDTDGRYNWQVSGLLSKPNFRPGKGRKKSTSKSKTTK